MNPALYLQIIQGIVTVLIFPGYLWYRLKRKEAPVKGMKAWLPRDFVDVIALGLLVPRLAEHAIDIFKKMGG